ncbi:uncharacterized protein B0P05DRAFT_522675 [Gilbertella persicaria]|uniref:uncharacterized protein n=1 Tax=Gilbertella persicaria TaxID=101096 RepID=UPI002220261D|nr:uncharacterized protein B0P05DRAFT_522675 [Gilbertella persicaria]KAI8097940.1 hypothetical protein B0P05DRAFT_522675 [Gilbertella persicaria]
MGLCCDIFLTILCPPLGVFIMRGCGSDFWINFCLSLFGYIPGHIHAFYLMVRENEAGRYKDPYHDSVAQP